MLWQRYKNTLLVLGIIALVLAGIAALDQGSGAPETATESIGLYPQAYMEDTDSRVYDEGGAPHYRLRTQQTLYFDSDPVSGEEGEFASLHRPHIALHSDDERFWQLTANSAQGQLAEEKMTLHKKVRAWQGPDEAPTTEVTTEELHIDIGEQYAETDKAVTMRGQQSHTTAVGMQVFFEREVIELLSEVQSRYDP